MSSIGASRSAGNSSSSANNVLLAGSSGSGIQNLNRPTASAASPVGGGAAVVAPVSEAVSGGLAFVSVPAEPTGASDGAASPIQQAAVSNNAAGRDLSGFMRVFVVQGGINLPEQASSTAEQNVGGQNSGAPRNTRGAQ